MISRSPRFIVILLVCLVLVASGCKSKKKAMEAQAAAERARVEQEAADKKKREDEEARKKREEEDKLKAEADAEAKRKASAMSTPAARLDQYFNAIAGSGNSSSANGSIGEALSLFASPQTPVLIVIADEGGMKDYDKPTTIQDYLNYLKDQKKNLNAISDLKFDGAGKITEVELTRKK